MQSKNGYIKRIVLICTIIFTFQMNLCMEITPNNVGVNRGCNYTFYARVNQSFTFYNIEINSDVINYNKQYNSTHIRIDYYVPEIITLKLYQFSVTTYNTNNIFLENATYNFGIVDLTDQEILSLYGTNKELQDIVNNYTNSSFNNSTLYNPWEDYKHESSFDKHKDEIMISLISAMSTMLVAGVAVIGSRVNGQIKEKRLQEKIKNTEENSNRILAKKKALKDDMYYCRDVPSKDGPQQAPIIDIDEKTAVEKITPRRSLAHFVRVTPELIHELYPDDPDMKMNSVDLIGYRFEEFNKGKKDENKLSATDKYCIVSAILANLIDRGCTISNEELYPVNCDLEDIQKYYAELGEEYDKEIVQIKQNNIEESRNISGKLEETRKYIVKRKRGNVTRTVELTEQVSGYKDID